LRRSTSKKVLAFSLDTGIEAIVRVRCEHLLPAGDARRVRYSLLISVN
jgi:hypothetical protein